MSGVVVAVGVGVVFLLVLVVGLVGLFLVRLGQDAAPSTDVAVTATLTPVDGGVRVHAEVTPVSGSLPDSLRVPDEVVQQDLASETGPPVSVGARSPVTALRVDGREVDPGSEVDVSGSRLVLDYEVGAQDPGGHRVAFSLLDLESLRPRQADVTVEGTPVSCAVPVGYRSGDQSRLWTEPCSGPTVRVQSGVPDRPGYSRLAIPAWVLVDFGP
ncbi:hypothetical protein [Phycicoccus flavus]|uniref:Uncharacterized protein n=1 Tax=Phycicoccus flavus TaxID=2502783 RepID=A0A8T6R7B0_9MICO|nr:hypothetical protein [Phycicoccus flavus]NHA69443.1 hypothetical protein [Phycicoccus flavus]